MSWCLEADVVISMDVGKQFRISVLSQVAVGAVACIAVDTASAELRQRVQIVSICFVRSEYHVPFQFRNISSRRVDPTVIRQFARRVFNSHEAATAFFHTFKKSFTVFKQMRVIQCRYPNGYSGDDMPFGHWFPKVAFAEDKRSDLDSRPHEFAHATGDEGFGATFRPSALNIRH